MVPGGGPLFQRMFTRLGCDGRPPRFRVEFYPYSSLVLTIRRREEVVFVRFSDLLQRAPLAVLEGAAALMISSEQVEICHVCDRAYVMREGRIAGHLSRNELTEENIVRLGMHHA